MRSFLSANSFADRFQQVTCRIALVAGVSFFSSLMASFVGRITSLIFRFLASRFTWSITGNAPVPVPITSLRHFQGMASFGETGVCPKASRNSLTVSFGRLREHEGLGSGRER